MEKAQNTKAYFIKKELQWLSVSIVLGMIISLAMGVSILDSSATFDINIRDSYFIIEGIFVCSSFIAFFSFTTFLVRVIVFKINNIGALLFLIISAASLLIILNIASAFLGIIETSWTLYPPLGGIENVNEPVVLWDYVSISIVIVQIFIIALVAYASFHSGKGNKP